MALASDARIVDHEAEDGTCGLISLVGVKYTEARRAAESAVDRVVARLGARALPAATSTTPLYGAEPRSGAAAPAPHNALARLRRVHGTRAGEVASAAAAVSWLKNSLKPISTLIPLLVFLLPALPALPFLKLWMKKICKKMLGLLVST